MGQMNGQATKRGLDILQSCSGNASHWVKDVEFESVITVWASVFALKITHAQLEVQSICATAVFGNVLFCIVISFNSGMKNTFIHFLNKNMLDDRGAQTNQCNMLYCATTQKADHHRSISHVIVTSPQFCCSTSQKFQDIDIRQLLIFHWFRYCCKYIHTWTIQRNVQNVIEFLYAYDFHFSQSVSVFRRFV